MEKSRAANIAAFYATDRESKGEKSFFSPCPTIRDSPWTFVAWPEISFLTEFFRSFILWNTGNLITREKNYVSYGIKNSFLTLFFVQKY